MKLINNSKGKNLNTYRDVIAVATVIFYILFSIIKRFGENENLIIIPLVLFFVNVLILFEIYFGLKKIGVQSRIKSKKWIIIQFFINLGFALLCLSYLI